MLYVYTLKNAADFANTIGEGSLASAWSATSDSIKNSLSSHWNGKFLTSMPGREIDGSVLHAVVTFGKY